MLAWDMVYQPLKDGGLGVQSLVTRKEAFIVRHAMWLFFSPDTIWSTIMRARYGPWPVDSKI